MLPIPSTAYRGKGRHNQKSYFMTNSSDMSKSAQSVIERLRGRTRLTNLGVSLILGLLGLSVLFNLRSWSSPQFDRPHIPLGRSTSESIEATIERSPEISSLTHLVMVAGHAIWKGADPELRSNDSEWVLTPIQKGGSVNTFYKHIQTGLVWDTIGNPSKPLN
jgi:hypothetical protein